LPVHPLNSASLRHLRRDVRVPTYARTALVPSVVHISVGSFHRSHQAVYFDELARLGEQRWGLVGVGLRRPEMREALVPQDGLYTVVARGRDRDEAQVVGAIRRYLFAPEDTESVVRSLADPRTRLVTLTVTAGGYDPAPHSTAMELLVAGLARRRAAGRAPFTVLSCDNLPDNGRVARDAVVAAAERTDPELADWIAERGAFPSSMVDRITPRTTDADRAFVAGRFGVEDRWPVMTEPYSQWVIEDTFGDGDRPPLERVGVRFTADVRPYALQKTRLLNAGHCALGYLGMLAGHERADTAMADPVLAGYLTRMMSDEIAPLLPDVPGIDLAAFQETTLDRIANPKLADPLARLGRAGSGKVPRHVVPSILESRRHGRPHPLLTLALAGWLLHLRGARVNDPQADRLRSLAGADPRPLLAQRDLFGPLGEDEAFADELETAMRAIDAGGARATLAARLDPVAA
jgi:mannitol 2-dehydrogenase